MPRRPLSAYNLFFREQRNLLLGTTEEEVAGKNPAPSRRKHRKTHGRIGFADLAKHISQKWRSLKKDDMYIYENEAKIRKKAYDKEVRHYKKMKHVTGLPADSVGAASSEESKVNDRPDVAAVQADSVKAACSEIVHADSVGTASSEETEDKDRCDYAAVLLSISQSGRGQPSLTEPCNESRATTKTSFVGSSANHSNENEHRKRLASVNSMHRYIGGSHTGHMPENPRQECAVHVFQPSMGVVPIYSEHGWPCKNNAHLNVAGHALPSVPIIDDAIQPQERLDRKEKLMFPEQIMYHRASVLSPSGRPWQNSLQMIDLSQRPQYQMQMLTDIPQQPIAKFSQMRPPILPGNHLIASNAPYRQMYPIQTQNVSGHHYTSFMRPPFVGFLPENLSNRARLQYTTPKAAVNHKPV